MEEISMMEEELISMLVEELISMEERFVTTMKGTDLISMMKEPYEAAMEGRWKDMCEWFNKDGMNCLLTSPLTVSKDTAFHVAVNSQSKYPLESLLEIAAKDPNTVFDNTVENAYGNTPLHDAAAIGNYEAVALLVGDKKPDLLGIRNKKGETPLLRAAAFGQTQIVEFLARQSQQMTPDNRLIDIHRYRTKNERSTVSILQAAIEGEHFETAIFLLKLDESLAESDHQLDMTSLELLANIPSAFRSGCHMGMWKQFFYFCLPDDDNDQNRDSDDTDDAEDGDCCKDLEGCLSKNNIKKYFSHLRKGGKKINLSIWRFLSRVSTGIHKLWKEKMKHKFAFRLAKMLIENDDSWTQGIPEDPTSYLRTLPRQESGQEKKEDQKTSIDRTCTARQAGEEQNDNGQKSEGVKEIPLFAATRNGIIEIVEEILSLQPQAVEYTNILNQNILHVAIKHRQKEILDRVKKMRMPTFKLVQGIDSKGYTILHCAAAMDDSTPATRLSGPAYKLQDELQWFRRVEKLLPSRYAMHLNGDNKTAKQLFKEKHSDQHNQAQKWLKETSQSGLAASAFVAAVVFAAAYELPGGSDENGVATLRHVPLFCLFTLADIFSLAGSLTSLVTFLSILTSPYDLGDFAYSLPRRLTFAFSLLFLSVATTMLSFAATVLIFFHVQGQRWTLTLSYTVAFVPVCILALAQFPLYVAFKESLRRIFKIIKKGCRIPRRISDPLMVRIRKFRATNARSSSASRPEFDH